MLRSSEHNQECSPLCCPGSYWSCHQTAPWLVWKNDNDIKTLLEEKHYLLWSYHNPSSAAKKAAFTYMRSKVQCKLHSMQDSGLSAKANEIQGYAD